MRRVWISKGVRPEVRRQTRHEWDYLYGALEVVEGHAEFFAFADGKPGLQSTLP